MAIPTIAFQNNLKIAQVANALYGAVVGSTSNAAVLADIASVGFDNTMNTYYSFTFAGKTAAEVATTMAANMGVTATTVGSQANVDAAIAYIGAQLTAAPGAEGAAVAKFLTAFASATGDATFGTAATTWNTAIANAQAYTNSGATVDTLIANAATGATYTLTTGVEAMLGTAGADTFNAWVLNGSNTLQSGDVIDGGAGTDTLFADMGVGAGFATIPQTSNIETVIVQAQAVPTDSINGNNMTGSAATAYGTSLDAQRMSGVTEWESKGSRSDVIIEDVRINSNVSTISFTESDPGNVDYGVYFNQRNLVNTTGGTATLNILVMDTAAAGATATAATPLKDIAFSSFTFYYDDTRVALGVDANGAITAAGTAINDSTTYAELLAAFQTALTTAVVGGTYNATTGLTTGGTVTDFSASVTASLSAVQNMTTAAGTSATAASFLNLNGQVLSLTAAGTGAITNASSTDTSAAGLGGWGYAPGVAPTTGAIVQTMNSGSTSSTALVNTNIILDDVGMGSTGGDLVVGGMSVGGTSASKGVERFNIEVRDNSKLQTINSTNDTLREVVIVNGVTSSTSSAYVTTVKDAGNLTVNGNANNTVVGAAVGAGNTNINVGTDTILPGVNAGNTLNSYTANHHAAFGFTNVRLIDASAMRGEFAFTAQVTSDAIAKYVNLVDTATSATADVASANVAGLGANFIYNGGTVNDTMAVTIDPAVAASRSTIVSGQSDFTFAIDGGAGNDTITVKVVDTGTGLNGNLQNWFNNQDLNNNITITGAAGNDTITTPGAGDTTIDAGAGADTIYTDNTGAQTGLTAGTGVSVTDLGNGTSSKGIWVFNTYDQVNAVANGAARDIYNLRSDINNTYNLLNATVTVSFKGVPATTITLANTATYTTTDFEINQAVKNAINNDATLSKLLVAQDGPGSSLIVSSLIDGVMATGDLSVTLASTTTEFTAAELAATNTAWGITTASGGTIAQQAAILATYTTNGDYVTQMAQDSAGINIVGAASTATSDNFITPGSDNDVIVLGTEVGVDTARSSNDVVTYAAAFGADVIVNFGLGGTMGVDHLNFASFLGSLATSLGALTTAMTDSLVTVAASGASNSTAALVQTLIGTTTDTTTAAASKSVYIVYDTNNVGSVYSVVNSAAVGDAVATLQGTIDLADTGWAALTLANFQLPVVSNDVPTGTLTVASEGANNALVGTTLTAVVNGQTITGTANIDTINTGGFTAVTMTGGGSNDLFVITNLSTGSVITDLVTGDDFTVAGTGVLTATTTGFTASATTSNTAALANATLTAAAAGATINMAAATGTFGFTLTGAAGNDTITGSALADALNSGATGTDTLNGGAGNDGMVSGGGTVTFNPGTGSNTITGAAGVDTINTAFGAIDLAGTIAGTDIVTVAAGGQLTVNASAAWTPGASSNAGILTINAGAAGIFNMSAIGGTVGITFAGNAGNDTITGTANADTISSNGGNDTITAGNGIDTITGAAGIDTINMATVILAANRDTVTAFTSNADKLVLGLANTTVATTAGAAVVTADTTVAGVGGGAYAMTGATTANADVILLHTNGTMTAVGANSGDLSLVTDGTELLKAMTTAAAADTYTGITAAAIGNTAYFVATQGGNSYVYYGAAGADTLITASELVLVGTFTGTAALIAADFTLA